MGGLSPGRGLDRRAWPSHAPVLKLGAPMLPSPCSGGPAGAAGRCWHSGRSGRWQRQRYQSSGRARRVTAVRHLVSFGGHLTCDMGGSGRQLVSLGP